MIWRAGIPTERYKWWAMGALSLGIFGGVLDQTSVNIALPVIASHFGTDLPTGTWVYLGYTVTISAALLPAGRLSDLMGRKRVYLIGLALTALGSGLAALAPSLLILILVKLLSGFGLAFMYANNMAIITAVFAGKERGQGLGLMSLMVGSGSIAGPVVGGALVTGVGWRAVFVFCMLVSLLALAAGAIVFEEHRISPPKPPGGPRGFDWAGAGFSAVALVAALLALTNANKLGWASPLIVGGLAGSILLAAAFVWWELRYREAMFDLRLFRRRAYTLGITSRFMLFLGTAAAGFLMPFYLQGALAYSARDAGLIVMSSSLVMAITGAVSGSLSDRFGWRPFTMGGMVSALVGMLILAFLTERSSIALVTVGLVLQGLGLGMFISPNLSSIFGSVEREKHSITTSFMNLVRNTANTAAIAISVAIVSATMVSLGHEPKLSVSGESGAGTANAFVTGMRYAFLGLGACLVIGFVAAAIKARRVEEEAPPAPAPD